VEDLRSFRAEAASEQGERRKARYAKAKRVRRVTGKSTLPTFKA